MKQQKSCCFRALYDVYDTLISILTGFHKAYIVLL